MSVVASATGLSDLQAFGFLVCCNRPYASKLAKPCYTLYFVNYFYYDFRFDVEELATIPLKILLRSEEICRRPTDQREVTRAHSRYDFRYRF